MRQMVVKKQIIGMIACLLGSVLYASPDLFERASQAGISKDAIGLYRQCINQEDVSETRKIDARINIACITKQFVGQTEKYITLHSDPDIRLACAKSLAYEALEVLKPIVGLETTQLQEVTYDQEILAWKLMADLYYSLSEPKEGAICDRNAFALAFERDYNSLGVFPESFSFAYPEVVERFASQCVYDRSLKKLFYDIYTDFADNKEQIDKLWVHFCKIAQDPDSFPSYLNHLKNEQNQVSIINLKQEHVGSYLLAQHKIDLKTEDEEIRKGQLQKAKKMLQGLVDKDYEPALGALVYVNWRLKEKDAAVAKQLAQQVKGDTTLLKHCESYFNEHTGIDGKIYFWNLLFRQLHNEPLRWQAAYTLSKLEKSPKSGLYLKLAADHEHEPAMIDVVEQKQNQGKLEQVKPYVLKLDRLGHRDILFDYVDLCDLKEQEELLKPLASSNELDACVKLSQIYQAQAEEYSKIPIKQAKKRAEKYQKFAQQYMRQAAGIDSHYLFDLGLYYLKLKNYQFARMYLSQFKEKHPDQKKGNKSLGRAYLGEGNIKEAATYYARAFDDAPRRTSGHLLDRITELIKEGKTKEAKQFRKLIRSQLPQDRSKSLFDKQIIITA